MNLFFWVSTQHIGMKHNITVSLYFLSYVTLAHSQIFFLKGVFFNTSIYVNGKTNQVFFSFQGEYRTDDIAILNTTGSAPSVIQSCDATPSPPFLPSLGLWLAHTCTFIPFTVLQFCFDRSSFEYT